MPVGGDSNGRSILAKSQMTEALIDDAFKLHHWIAARLDDVDVPKQRRILLSVLCYDLVIEHHVGIATLLQSKVNGSAFALVRPLFEGFVRGAWLRHCATDAEVDRYVVNDRIDHEFGELVEAVEGVDAFRVGVFSRLKNSAWRAMNSYTHGGMQQIDRRRTGSYIQPNYPHEAIAEVANLSWIIRASSVPANRARCGSPRPCRAGTRKGEGVRGMRSAKGPTPCVLNAGPFPAERTRCLLHSSIGGSSFRSP